MQRACFLHQLCSLGCLNTIKLFFVFFFFFYQGASVSPARPHSHTQCAPLAVLLVQDMDVWSCSDTPEREDLCECPAGTADPHSANASFARAAVGSSGRCRTIV